MLPFMERGNEGHRRCPVLITADTRLVEAVMRLAAAAAVDVAVVSDLEGARRLWASAPLIVVGADLARDLADGTPSRRAGVVLVGAGSVEGHESNSEIWREAVSIGAEHVVQLPDAGGWLIQRLGESADGPSRSGFVTAVTSATGGCGGSTLAASLALTAQAQSGRVLLIDGDPDGGGLDLLLGAEEASGIRWADLAAAQGRLSAATLDYALPHPGGVALLSHGRAGAVRVSGEAFTSVLGAGVRGYEQVFIDVPRSAWGSAPEMLELADRTILLVPGRVRGIAAAAAALPWLRETTKEIVIVVRSAPRGVAPREVERALGFSDLPVLPEQQHLATRADRGEPVLARDAYAKAVRALLADAMPVKASVA
jgi:secretion/DNA translocation related CpaE-like protein